MKSIRELPQPAREELRRLDQVLVQALLAKDEPTIITCRLLWAECYLRAGGERSPALPHLTAALDDIAKQTLTPSERWEQEKRARPLVAVVEHKAVTWHDSAGCEHTYYRETLACGHTHNFVIFWPDEKPARRRRCHKCGQIARWQLLQRKPSLAPAVVTMPERAVAV